MTRVAALAAAWAATAALTLPGAGRTAGLRAVLLVLAAGCLVLGVRWGWALFTTLSVGLLVGSYGVGLVFRETVDERAPLVAAGVMAVVLLASWAAEHPTRPVDPGGDPWPARAGRVAAATLGALALAAVVLAASAAGTSRGLWLQVAGAAATVAAVAALAALAGRPGGGGAADAPGSDAPGSDAPGSDVPGSDAPGPRTAGARRASPGGTGPA